MEAAVAGGDVAREVEEAPAANATSAVRNRTFRPPTSRRVISPRSPEFFM